MHNPSHDEPSEQHDTTTITMAPHLVRSERLIIAFLLFGIVMFGANVSRTIVAKHHHVTSAPQSTRSAATFVISCGKQETDAVEEMGPLLKSILILTSQPVRLIFLTDEESVHRIVHTFSRVVGRMKRRLLVDVYYVTTTAIEQFAKRINLDAYSHHSGRWGTAKLMIPWLLRDTERVILVDTDMVFIEDPMNLWALFDDDDDKWAFKMPLHKSVTQGFICSCVILMNLKVARNRRVYPDLMDKALKKHGMKWLNEETKLYVPNHGDQGVYELLVKQNRDLFRSLPDPWNNDRCHKFYGAFKKGSRRAVGLLHRNCGGKSALRVHDEATPFFDFFINYKWHWLRADEKMGYEVSVRTDVFRVVPSSMRFK